MRLADADATLPTRVERLRVARLNDSADGTDELLAFAARTVAAADQEVRAQLMCAVPEYRPS